MQSYWLLKQMVHVVTTALLSVNWKYAPCFIISRTVYISEHTARSSLPYAAINDGQSNLYGP
jgi:hypothetical protein